MTADRTRAQAELRLTLALTASFVVHAALVAFAQQGATAPVPRVDMPALSVNLETDPRPPTPPAQQRVTGAASSGLTRDGTAADAPARLTPALPYYYTAAQLDERPRPLTPIVLPEPADPLAAAYVVVRLRIAETGMVDDATVLVDDAPARTAAGIVAVFGAARYAPGLRRGQAVKSELLIEVKIAPAG